MPPPPILPIDPTRGITIRHDVRTIVNFLGSGKGSGGKARLSSALKSVNDKLGKIVGPYLLHVNTDNWQHRVADRVIAPFIQRRRAPAEVTEAAFRRVDQLLASLQQLAPRPVPRSIDALVKEVIELSNAISLYAWHMAHAHGLLGGGVQRAELPNSNSTRDPFAGKLTRRAMFDRRAIHPNDIKQGDLGTCWLLSALAAMARTDPRRLEQIMHDNGDGTVTVLLDRFGKTARIKLDNRFPSQRSGQKPTPLYAKSGDTTHRRPGSGPPHRRRMGPRKTSRELWPMMLEKSIAVDMGGWDNADFGDPRNSLKVLGGASAKPKNYMLADLSEHRLVSLLREADKAGHPVVLGTYQALPDREGMGKQLAPAHAYAFMGLSGSRAKLRDPYGKTVSPTSRDLKRYFQTMVVGYGI